jgi:hypothetical protein
MPVTNGQSAASVVSQEDDASHDFSHGTTRLIGWSKADVARPRLRRIGARKIVGAVAVLIVVCSAAVVIPPMLAPPPGLNISLFVALFGVIAVVLAVGALGVWLVWRFCSSAPWQLMLLLLVACAALVVAFHQTGAFLDCFVIALTLATWEGRHRGASDSAAGTAAMVGLGTTFVLTWDLGITIPPVLDWLAAWFPLATLYWPAGYAQQEGFGQGWGLLLGFGILFASPLGAGFAALAAVLSRRPCSAPAKGRRCRHSLV